MNVIKDNTPKKKDNDVCLLELVMALVLGEVVIVSTIGVVD